MLKQYLSFALILLSLICDQKPGKSSKIFYKQNDIYTDSGEVNNNFYDNTETYKLPVEELFIGGEVANPGKVDFSQLPVRQVIVKEALLDTLGGDRFTGAFRYDGYSLFDILESTVIKKNNSAEFNQVIDLFVEIENDEGERVVFSWGEIFYPVNLHKIIIAAGVSRIVPSKTGELWSLPGKSRLVAANDLVTERNISSPDRITVKSYPRSFHVVKGMNPMYAGAIKIIDGNKTIGEVTGISQDYSINTFNTIFYGRGKGIHSTSPFSGPALKEVILNYFPVSSESLKTGLICIAGVDGYRCVVSYSELFNRNDQQEFLLIKTGEGEDGGLFRIFAAADFFSDRAIKSVCEIHKAL